MVSRFPGLDSRFVLHAVILLREKTLYILELGRKVKLFDSHCHLDDDIFLKDIDEVLSRFKQAGGMGLIIAGIDANSSRKALRLAETNEMCFASLGVHPHHASECSNGMLNELENLSTHPKVRAWGEIGLDYNRMYSSVKDQEKWFIRQIELADEKRLPIIFHERDTNGRFLDILKHYSPTIRNGVVHCFSGNRKELEAYLELGLSIGITGIITMKSRGDQLRGLVSEIPSDRILVETDAPWLTPSPESSRCRRNEPAFVRAVLSKLAVVRGESPDKLAEITFRNTCRLFRILQ